MRVRRSRAILVLVVAAVLAPGALVAYAKPTAGSKHATGLQHTTGIPGLPGFVQEKEVNLRNVPGDPVKGLEVFRVFCAGCHNFKSAGLQGENKPGSDLDDRKPTYTKVVTLISQGGGGGAPSKELLQQLTFSQIYDVAKYVALYAGKAGPVRGATVEPPKPVELAAPLVNAQSQVQGHFTATLAGTALRWHIRLSNTSDQPSWSKLVLKSASGDRLRTVVLDCDRCIDPGSGFVLLTQAQAAAVTDGQATLVVPNTGLATGPVRGSIHAGPN